MVIFFLFKEEEGEGCISLKLHYNLSDMKQTATWTHKQKNKSKK